MTLEVSSIMIFMIMLRFQFLVICQFGSYFMLRMYLTWILIEEWRMALMIVLSDHSKWAWVQVIYHPNELMQWGTGFALTKPPSLWVVECTLESIPAWIKFSPGEIPYSGIYYDSSEEIWDRSVSMASLCSTHHGFNRTFNADMQWCWKFCSFFFKPLPPSLFSYIRKKYPHSFAQKDNTIIDVYNLSP